VSFSVVIPTFRRAETLFPVLDALAAQLEPPEFEVVVVDDGSGDDTLPRLRSYRPPYPFRFFSQENAGPATARNRGVREARGAVVVFLGDDTVPEPPLLSIHARTHAEKRPQPVAVLGYTTWPLGLRVSPFLHHINEYGLQFGYGLIHDPEEVPFNFFYTSNVSLPRDLLLEVGLFDTSFPHAAWEDIEVAYRLMQRGLRMVYQEKAGEAAAIFYRKHPELGDFLAVPLARTPAPRETLANRFFSMWASLAERSEIPGTRWAVDRVLKEDYLRGLRRGLAEDGGSIPRNVTP
jgi:glycosyltransferase involved in cell wall biosynthesis